jgi:methylmalonyl-CoA/ethylmalonyl-CoA epimerase
MLGMKHLFSAGNMSFFDCDGVRLLLGLREPGKEQHFNSVLYFRVANIEAAHQTLVSRGVNFIEAPHLVARMQTHDLWICFFRDSEGNTLALMSEVAH